MTGSAIGLGRGSVRSRRGNSTHDVASALAERPSFDPKRRARCVVVRPHARRPRQRAGTSTRAVYSLFASKEGLLVDSLAQDAFEFLYTEIGELERNRRPGRRPDRRRRRRISSSLVEHPALYRSAFQRICRAVDAGPELVAIRRKHGTSSGQRGTGRGGRSYSTGGASRRNACSRRGSSPWRSEGLARLRGAVRRLLPENDEGQAWRTASMSLVRGFGSGDAAGRPGAARPAPAVKR